MMTPKIAMENSKDRLMQDLKAVMADAEELLKATASQTGERIATARAKAEETLQSAKIRLGEVQGIALEQAKVVAKKTDNYVSANPWQAVGIATAVGIAIGALISRR